MESGRSSAMSLHSVGSWESFDGTDDNAVAGGKPTAKPKSRVNKLSAGSVEAVRRGRAGAKEKQNRKDTTTEAIDITAEEAKVSEKSKVVYIDNVTKLPVLVIERDAESSTTTSDIFNEFLRRSAAAKSMLHPTLFGSDFTTDELAAIDLRSNHHIHPTLVTRDGSIRTKANYTAASIANREVGEFAKEEELEGPDAAKMIQRVLASRAKDFRARGEAFLKQAKAYEEAVARVRDGEDATKIYQGINDRNESVGMAKYVKFPSLTKQEQLEHELHQKDHLLTLAERLRQESAPIVAFIARHGEMLAKREQSAAAASCKLMDDLALYGKFEVKQWQIAALPTAMHACQCPVCVARTNESTDSTAEVVRLPAPVIDLDELQVSRGPLPQPEEEERPQSSNKRQASESNTSAHEAVAKRRSVTFATTPEAMPDTDITPDTIPDTDLTYNNRIFTEAPASAMGTSLERESMQQPTAGISREDHLLTAVTSEEAQQSDNADSQMIEAPNDTLPQLTSVESQLLTSDIHMSTEPTIKVEEEQFEKVEHDKPEFPEPRPIFMDENLDYVEKQMRGWSMGLSVEEYEMYLYNVYRRSVERWEQRRENWTRNLSTVLGTEFNPVWLDPPDVRERYQPPAPPLPEHHSGSPPGSPPGTPKDPGPPPQPKKANMEEMRRLMRDKAMSKNDYYSAVMLWNESALDLWQFARQRFKKYMASKSAGTGDTETGPSNVETGAGDVGTTQAGEADEDPMEE